MRDAKNLALLFNRLDTVPKMAYDEDMKMRFLLCLALAAGPAIGVYAAPASMAAPRAPSLAEALAAMPATSVAGGSAVLTVQPQEVQPVPMPTDGETAPPDNEAAAGEAVQTPGEAVQTPGEAVQTPDTLAVRYGRSLQVFGHVLALAPPTMTVLNLDPALADTPLGQLAGQHPETYLLGSLSAEQLRQAGTGGLAYADMTAGQQSLMHALLPEPLEIVPTAASPLDDKMDKAQRAAFDAQIQKVSGDDLLGSLKLHAYLDADFFVHAPVGYGIGDTRALLPSTGAYKLPFGGYGNMEARGKPTENILKADVPNAPKPGDLRWTRHDLERTVSLGGLTTVDALVARLGAAMHLELYADPHYGPLPVAARGDLRAELAAGEVMQALAVCVCGTWRQVGAAFVLTDDVQGLGTRQEFLAEIGQVWSSRLSAAGKDAGTHLQALDWMHALSFAPGDIGALSPDQITAIQKASGTNEGSLPWHSLPPPLQEHLQDTFLHYGDNLPKNLPSSASSLSDEMTKMGDDMKAAAGSVTPNSPVDTTINIRLAVELPNTGAMMLFGEYRVQPPEPDRTGDSKADAKEKPDAPKKPGGVALDKPLRGVLCAPKTPEEARAAVAKLAEMGLNTLFLDVFTGGRTYFPNDALPPASADAGGVLHAALAAAKPRHIAVYAVMDTLCWRKDGLTPHPQAWPQGFAEDVTISGETPDQTVQRRAAAGSLDTSYEHSRLLLAREGTEGWASPFDPAVQTLLPALVRAVAATPGLAGLVLEDAVPPGYDGSGADRDGLGLGYTLPSRLTYLRGTHRDPVDITTSYGDSVSVFVSGEFFFGNYQIDIPTFRSDRANYTAWTKWREDADKLLLMHCRRAAQTAAPALPLLRRSVLSSIASFDPWTEPQTAPDSAPPAPRQASDRVTPQSILDVPFGPDAQAHPDQFFGNAEIGAATGWGHRAGGEVFDLVTGGPPTDLLDALDKLGVLVKK